MSVSKHKSKSKSKQTPSDTRGSRVKRNARDRAPEREESSSEPLDDLYGDSNGAVDSEMELDTGRYEAPIRRRHG